MADPKYFDNKSDKEIISIVHGNPGEAETQAAKMELERRMSMRLSESIKSLKEKVNWLNWILVAATVVGAVATVFMAWKQFYP